MSCCASPAAALFVFFKSHVDRQKSLCNTQYDISVYLHKLNYSNHTHKTYVNQHLLFQMLSPLNEFCRFSRLTRKLFRERR